VFVKNPVGGAGSCNKKKKGDQDERKKTHNERDPSNPKRQVPYAAGDRSNVHYKKTRGGGGGKREDHLEGDNLPIVVILPWKETLGSKG